MKASLQKTQTKFEPNATLEPSHGPGQGFHAGHGGQQSLAARCFSFSSLTPGERMGTQACHGPGRGTGGHCYPSSQPSPCTSTVAISLVFAQATCTGGCMGQGGLSPLQDQLLLPARSGVTLGMGLGLLRPRGRSQAGRTAGTTVLMHIMMMRSCCWHILNEAHGWSPGIQAKGRDGRLMISCLAHCFSSYVVALHRGDELPLGISVYWKTAKSREKWPRAPWDITSSCPPSCGLGAWYQETLQSEMVFLLSEVIMCWNSAAELTPVRLWCPLGSPDLGRWGSKPWWIQAQETIHPVFLLWGRAAPVVSLAICAPTKLLSQWNSDVHTKNN